jgi:flagellar biogenesis protein FliO
MINPNRFLGYRQGKISMRYPVVLAVVSVLILILFFLFPGESTTSDAAQIHSGNNGESVPFNSNYSYFIFRTLGITGFIIVLILVGFKWYKNKLSFEDNYFSMEVLGKQHINPKQYLMMVRIEGRKLLLGVSEQSINLIKEFIEEKKMD